MQARWDAGKVGCRPIPICLALFMGSRKNVKSDSAVDLPYMPRIVSEDAGKTWREEPPLGVTGKDDPFVM